MDEISSGRCEHVGVRIPRTRELTKALGSSQGLRQVESSASGSHIWPDSGVRLGLPEANWKAGSRLVGRRVLQADCKGSRQSGIHTPIGRWGRSWAAGGADLQVSDSLVERRVL